MSCGNLYKFAQVDSLLKFWTIILSLQTNGEAFYNVGNQEAYVFIKT
jgi:hypothetical protein